MPYLRTVPSQKWAPVFLPHTTGHTLTLYPAVLIVLALGPFIVVLSQALVPLKWDLVHFLLSTFRNLKRFLCLSARSCCFLTVRATVSWWVLGSHYQLNVTSSTMKSPPLTHSDICS